MFPNKVKSRLFLILPSYGDSKSAIEIGMEVRNLVDNKVIVCILDDSLGQDDFQELPSDFNLFRPTRNLGQQRILVNFLRSGLRNFSKFENGDLVVIMDADGEDAPEDVSKLLSKLKDDNLDLVLATRESRKVGIGFKTGYIGFRLLVRILAGLNVNTGTFSASRRDFIERTVHADAFEQSMSGGLLVSNGKKSKIACERRPRRYGQSRMNRTNLILHGLRVLLALAPMISVRLLIFTSACGLMSILAVAAVLVMKFNGYTTPGWSTFALFGIMQAMILLLTMLIVSIGMLKQFSPSDQDLEFKLVD
jgi:hypothetical protein